MKLELSISKPVIDRLSKTKSPCYGKLYGIISNNTVYILELEQHTGKESLLRNAIPVQMSCYGVFQIGYEDLTESCKKILLEEVSHKESLVVISRKTENSVLSVGCYIVGNLQNCSYNELVDVNSQFIYIHIKGSFLVQCEASTEHIEKKIAEHMNIPLVFNLTESEVFLLNSDKVASRNFDIKSSISQIYEAQFGQLEDRNKKKHKTTSKPKIIESAVWNVSSRSKDDQSLKQHAISAYKDEKERSVLTTVVNIDCLSMVHVDQTLKGLHEILLKDTAHTVDVYQTNTLSRLEMNQDFQLETFHFYPKQCEHFFTLVYPKSEEEGSLKQTRQLLHKKLLIEDYVPIFRRGNRYIVEVNDKPNQPLINPHEVLKPTDNGGQVALVKGFYQYYHYCQNGADDSGWGCAYRSLQTLASWFKLQCYIDKEVPSFHDIQKCLVDIKDKPSNFLGSRQWIGSTEVSFVLNSLLGIDCRILRVSSGEEMGTIGPELVEHFLTHGSPIMIGGGVLAHTILGVDYNRETGEVRFLILDPHYTGTEDIHVIQSKGWCGWKKVNFWNKTSFYNMCMPLVPKDI